MKPAFLSLLALILFGCKQAPTEQPDITAPSALMCAPALSDIDWYGKDTPAPLFEGLGNLNFPITTSNPEAQKFFNQGMTLAYAFNHSEAARSFFHATRLDSTCAMCHWGFAYVLGPNYNAGMDADNYIRAFNAIEKAKKYQSKVTQKEKDLIAAMATRYTKEVPEDRSHLDSAYMEALKLCHAKYPKDVDIAAMYAESLMDMHPWDLWEKNGNAKPWTPAILEAIQVAINLDTKHPGGHHFNIHAWEASGTPGKALASCKVFDDGLVPNAGHLVHMPSHIYIHTGDYHLGTLANINAVNRDSLYVTQCHAQGAYPLALYPHNYHFLAACATLEGDSKSAIMAAKKMEYQTRHKGMLLPPLATLQHYNSIPYFIYVKFGLWDEVLNIPPLDSSPVYINGIRHYARGMAFMGHNDLIQARAELVELKAIAKDDTLKSLTIWEINSLADVMSIAEKVLEGEILASEKKYEESIAVLKEAIVMEDALNYNEPPDWFFAVRHHLGAIMLEAGKASEAETIFLEDLKYFPRNGWALSGLKKAYEDMKQADKATETGRQFEEAWKYADVTLVTSRTW